MSATESSSDRPAVELPHDWEAYGGVRCGYCDEERISGNVYGECPARLPARDQAGVFTTLTGQRFYREVDPLLIPPLTDGDLAEIRQRIRDAARAYQGLGAPLTSQAGMLPGPIHMSLACDIPHLLGEVERLRALIDQAMEVTTTSLDGDDRVAAHEARGDRVGVVFYAGAQMAIDWVRVALGGEVSW